MEFDARETRFPAGDITRWIYLGQVGSMDLPCSIQGRGGFLGDQGHYPITGADVENAGTVRQYREEIVPSLPYLQVVATILTCRRSRQGSGSIIGFPVL